MRSSDAGVSNLISVTKNKFRKKEEKKRKNVKLHSPEQRITY